MSRSPRPTLVFLLTVIVAPASGAFDTARPAVQSAYSGVASDDSLASVSIVGSGMQNSPGYASRMFRVLANGNVNIDMITTSEIRISCIIKENDAHEAVRLLHEGFDLDRV